MPDDSQIRGRMHTTAHIRSFVRSTRWSWWYRRNKPDHNRSNTDDYQYSSVNAEAHGDVADQYTNPFTYAGHYYERVDDNPALWYAIGQIPIAIYNAITSIRTIDNMQIQMKTARAVVSWNYPIQIDDHVIQLAEGVPAANRVEWKVEEVTPRDGQYWSVGLVGLVGVHG